MRAGFHLETHAAGRTRGCGPVGRTWRLYAGQHRHRSDDATFRQYVRLPEMAPRNDLLGTRRLRCGPDGRTQGQHQGGYGRELKNDRPWGANIASQPNTARHIISARRRGAKVITVDVRRTEG